MICNREGISRLQNYVTLPSRASPVLVLYWLLRRLLRVWKVNRSVQFRFILSSQNVIPFFILIKQHCIHLQWSEPLLKLILKCDERTLWFLCLTKVPCFQIQVKNFSIKSCVKTFGNLWTGFLSVKLKINSILLFLLSLLLFWYILKFESLIFNFTRVT